MLETTRKTKYISGVLLVVLGLPLLVLPMFIEGKLWELLLIGGLGAIAVGMGAYQLFQGYQLRDVRKSPVFFTIQNHPERIVWIYEFVMVVNGVPNRSLYLWCKDGKKFEFNLRQLDVTELMGTLAHMMPHAVFGYSAELKALYRKSPADFIAAAAS